MEVPSDTPARDNGGRPATSTRSGPVEGPSLWGGDLGSLFCPPSGAASQHRSSLEPDSRCAYSSPRSLCASSGRSNQAMTKSATMTYCTYDLNKQAPAPSMRRVPKNAGCTTVQFFYQGSRLD